MRKIGALIIFVVLQIACMPLAIVGAAWVTYKQIIVSKRLGVSQTAVEIINGRWTMHKFGVRPDPSSVKLAEVLPNTSTVGLWMALAPLYAYARISGAPRWYPTIAPRGEEKLANLVTNRSVYIDGIIARAVADAEQLVMLGSGLDTRAYNDLKSSGLQIFEVDQPTNLAHKRRYLQQAGIDSAHVTFVESDFTQADWVDGLLAAGYAEGKRSIFLWEGVTLYLGEGAVSNTLRAIKGHSAEKSIVIADFYSKRFTTGAYAPGLKASLPLLDATDEALAFGLQMAGDAEQALEEFVSAEGLTVGETYFMGSNTPKGSWMVVAELIV